MSKKKRTTIRGKYHKRLHPRNLFLKSWSRKLSIEQIADNIGINTITLYDWENTYQSAKYCPRAKEIVVSLGENALIKRELGHTVAIEEEKMIQKVMMELTLNASSTPDLGRSS